MELTKFRELGLSENMIKALQKKGFEEPSPIQAATIPLLLKGDIDLIGQAQTGTGKTAAFGIPMIENLPEKAKDVQALILAPTRELAIQVAEELNSLKGKKKLEIFPIYGGSSIDQQFRKLKRGVDIVVGTPGRVQDHINRGTLDLSNIKYMILDEADEMLNMGFVDDVEKILKTTPKEKRMLLFSATMPPEILRISKKYMQKYEVIGVKKQELTTSLTDQIYFEVAERDKFEALSRIIDIESNFYGIVFCRTKLDVDRVSNKLADRGYDAEALHGDISQHQRVRVLNKFKNKRVNILVATDVAARGIDVNDLTHVINYAIPQEAESYVHRIGRTGRAGKEGTAITFVTKEEYRKLLFIKRVAKTEIRKEKVPGVKEVLEAKRLRFKQDIEEHIEEEKAKDIMDMASDLLSGNDPLELVAALLKYNLQGELDENNYSNIREQNFSSNVNNTGKSRLFVALGKQDNYTPKKLVDFIKEKTNVDPRKLQSVKIFDKFSFITVPFEEAEIIIEVFKKKRGQRAIVERAKEKK